MRDTTVLDRGNLAHGSAAPAIANDVDQDVDALGDVTRDRRFSKLSGAREQQREAVDGTRRRTRMYGREGAFVPGAERLDQRRRLARRADFANEDAIGTHAQSVRDEIGDPDAGPVTHRHALEMHDMRMLENELVRVFDHDESLVVRYRRGEGAEQRALARSGGTAHEDARALAHAGFKQSRRIVEQTACDPGRRRPAQRHREPVELPDRKAGPAYRRDDRRRPASLPHTRADASPLDRHLPSHASRDP